MYFARKNRKELVEELKAANEAGNRETAMACFRRLRWKIGEEVRYAIISWHDTLYKIPNRQ